jgi:hypothetical protein
MRLRSPSRTLILLSSVLIPLSFARAAAAQEPSPSPSPSASPEPAPPEPAAPPPATTEVPPGAEGAGGPSGPLPVYGGGAASSKVFNPDIAVIGDFLGAAGKNDSPFATPSLELHEAEASLQAIVDPYARADFFLTFGHDEVGVEEGFITFTSLPGSFLLKVGKMRGSFGKVNQMHNHILPWTDRPLLVQNLLGGEDGIDDAGLSLSRLFPNKVVFLEATGEVYRGETGVFHAPRRGDLLYVGRLRAYRDLTESTNLDVGGSVASGHNDLAAQRSDAGLDPSGFTTQLYGFDATLRYRPLRRAIYKRLLARTELVWSRRQQEAGTAAAFGAYVSLDYQFARRWFAGTRWDRSDRADDPALVDKAGSFLVTYWPSEFSQIRGQYRHTSYGEGIKANEVLFQLLFSIGAHGAHTF